MSETPHPNAKNNRYSVSSARQIIVIYALFSGLWILVSDSVISALLSDPLTIGKVSIAKGWLFVAITALLLYSLIRRMQLQAQKASESEVAAQRERAESELRIRALYQAIPDLVWFKDTEGVYLSCNFRFEQFFGAPENAIVGKTDYDFVARDLADAFRKNDQLAMAHGGPSSNEEWVVFACDGHRELLETTKTPVRNARGEVIGVLGIGHDITKRKRSELALIESEARWKFAIEGAGDGLWDWSIQTGKAFYSPRYKSMLGFSEEEMGDSADEWSRRIHPDDAPGVFASLQPYMEGKPGSATLEFRMLRKDGAWMWTMGRGLVVERDSQGKPLRMIGTNSDIGARKAAESALRESEARLRTVVEFTREAIAVHQDGIVVFVNPATVQMIGAASAQDMLGKPMLDFVHPDYRQVVLARLKAHADAGLTMPLVEEKFIRLDQRVIDVEVQGAAIEFMGRPATQVAMRDITERKLAESKLQLAASVFGHAREGIAITDFDGNIVDINDAFTRITGYGREESVGRNPRFLSSGRHDAAFYAAMWNALSVQGHWSGEVWNRRKNGEVYAELLTISAVRNGQGSTQQYVSLFSDITAIKEHQRQLEHIAHFDALTNLPNRLLLADRLQQAMAQAQRRNQQLAVVYLDLDGFKGINDRHGHDMGDQLLVHLANAMKETLREGDTLARLGGDEFVAVLIDLEGAESCVPMLTRLLEAVATPSRLAAFSLTVTASIGVTFFPQAHEVEADQLLRQADQAMYQAKLAGKNRYHVFDAAHDSSLRVHHESLERIRLALARGEFVLHFQPKVNMQTGEVVGAEALIRWQHPEKGLLPPASFLPVIEDHALSVEVGEWVIDTALTQIEAWHGTGLKLAVSVNIGARQLQQANFVARLQAILARHPGVSPAVLELEVLETSALADMEQVAQVIEDCHQLGVKFALDDFGTGYSSLTYLKRLRVALLKIDQSFVRDMLDDPDDLAILEGIIGLAGAFKREVIAEGVETVAHGTLLLKLGCQLAQGYGIARPMPAQRLQAWTSTWRPDEVWCAARRPDLQDVS